MALICNEITDVASTDCRMSFLDAKGNIVFQFDLARTTYTTQANGVQVRDQISTLNLSYDRVAGLGHSQASLIAKIDADRGYGCCYYS